MKKTKTSVRTRRITKKTKIKRAKSKKRSTKTKHKVVKRHIKKSTKKSSLKKSFKQEFTNFVQSFKNIRLNYVFVALYDLIFFISVFILSNLFKFIVEKISANIDVSALANGATAVSEEQAVQMELAMSQLSGFMISVVALLIVFIVLGIGAYALSRGLIWNYLLDKKINKKYFGKFFLLNLIWVVIIAIILAILVFLLLKTQAYVWLTLILSILFALIGLKIYYLMGISFIQFTKDKKLQVFNTFKTSFEFALKNKVKMIIPVLMIILAFVVFNLITLIFNFLPETGIFVMNLIIALIFFVWLRYYFLDVYQKLSK